MKKIKKLLAVFAAVGVALMLPLQTIAAVDLNAKYDISTNQIQGWPAGPDITSDTGILMDADTGVVLFAPWDGDAFEETVIDEGGAYFHGLQFPLLLQFLLLSLERNA